MIVRRSRTVSAPVDEVWRIVRDPYHLPRWWPRTQRVEGVSSSGWTSVLLTDKGRAVRADYRVELSKGSERRRWSQELAGTAFESLFQGVTGEVALAPGEGGTAGGIEMVQRPKGRGRGGGVMFTGAAGQEGDEGPGRPGGGG